MEIQDTPMQKTLSVRLTTGISDLPQIVGDVYGTVMAYMNQISVGPSGFPFVIYYNMDMEALDVEIGFPVSCDVPGNGTVTPGSIPAERILCTVHTGPYSTLEDTYRKAMTFIEEHGLKPKEWMYESYLNSPMETPEDQLQTAVCFPLE